MARERYLQNHDPELMGDNNDVHQRNFTNWLVLDPTSMDAHYRVFMLE